jgi:glycosyltransferase involved in cell wall biosynthesis
VRPSPFFSVVIPTYNQADFLRSALASVLGQTFEEFEVIVVNNKSTDATLGVIAEFGDPRVKVIDFQNHGVIGAARNVGIRASRAPYVAFLDTDDTWSNNKLERIAAFEDDPEIGLVCHDQEVFAAAG